jgi:hypothetical protein
MRFTIETTKEMMKLKKTTNTPEISITALFFAINDYQTSIRFKEIPNKINELKYKTKTKNKE